MIQQGNNIMNKYSEALKKHLACLLILISGLFCGTAMADSPQGGQELPYSYSFEDNNLATDGWVLQGATSQYTGIGSNTDFSGSVRTGSYVFKFNFAERNAYLLSPVLKSGDNSVTVSFWYKELSNQYGDEQFQVGYTTNENETGVNNFIYDKEVVTASTSWQEYKKEFPAGTKRIAIKYIYNDAHILFLDDFVFESVTAPKELPYSYGFENNDLAAAGWELQGSTISSTGISDLYVRTGSYDFRFNFAERNAYLLSPVFKSGANGVRVSFWYKRRNDIYIEQFQVGYTTDEYQTDASKFTYGEVVTASTSWQEYNHDFPVGTKRIAIKYVYNNAYYLYLDDFTFECYTSYPRPKNVAVSNVGMNSAVISWTSDASAWNLRYRKSGEEEWTTKEGISKSTGYTIDNLAKGSVYEVQVQAVEGDEVSDWTSTVHFTTAVELPYSYGFENKDLTADGWVLLQGITHQNTGIGGNGGLPGYGRTGETFVSYYGYPDNYLLSPVLKNGTNDVVVVSFWYRELFDGGYEKILVGYTTDEYQTDASKFTYNGELVTASTSWQEYTNEFPKGTKRIAIRHTYGQNNFLLLDDFTFEFYPRPKNVAVSNVSMNSAVVSWTSDASAWNLRYRKSGEEQWTTKKGVSQSTGYTVDNLTDGSRYEVQVQAVKDDKVSDWTSSVNFTTLMDLPYSYSFENNDLLADGWILQDATSTSTGIRQNYGRTGSYSFMFHYSEMNALLSPTFKSGANDVAVSFWYRAYNSKYPEQFQVGYTTNANETDASKFTYGDVVTASMTSWQEYTNEFPAGTRRIAIKYIDNDSYYLYLDDFAFWESGYPRPTDVAVSSIGMNSAVIGWTSDASAWNLRYRKSGEQWTIKEGISQSTGYTIDNLTKGTKYEVQVQAVKGDKVSGWTNSVSFTTAFCSNENQYVIKIELTDYSGDGWNGGKLEAVNQLANEVLGTYTVESGSSASYTLAVCPDFTTDFVYTQGSASHENGWRITSPYGDVISENVGCGYVNCAASDGIQASYAVVEPKDLPYSYGFENNNLSADGWWLRNTDNSYASIFDSDFPYVRTGEYAFVFSPDEMNAYLLSPVFKSGTDAVKVSFWYKNSITEYDAKFQVGYTTNENEPDANKFTYGDVVTASTESWQEYKNDFPIGTRRIAIKYINNSEWELLLDDFVFEKSSFPSPMDVAVSNISMNSAVVSWTSGANAWNLRYRKSGEVQWTTKEGIRQSTGYTIDNLIKGTEYEVQLQAVYDGVISDWCYPVSFVTAFCSNQCNINIDLTDYYGDGWTGGKLEAVIKSMDEVLGTYTYTLESGRRASYTLAVCPNCKIDFVYTQGEYPEENGWHITDVNGEVIDEHVGCFNGGCEASNGVQATYTVDCTVIPWKRPSGLAISEIASNSAKLSWTENSLPAATSWVIAYKADGTSDFTDVQVSGNPYTLTGLIPETRYTVKVRPVTNDGVIRWSKETSFSTKNSTSAPTGFTISGLTNTSAFISWDGFANSYDVRYGVLPEGSEPSSVWLQYDNGAYATEMGNDVSQTYTWGVLYPGSQVIGSKLTKVSIYEQEGYNINDITINIYQGGDEAPGTLIYTETVSTEHADAFHEVTLAKPVDLVPGKNLWITLTETGTYVIPVSYTTETSNQWILDGGSWFPMEYFGSDDYCWMIRGHIETNDVDDESVAWTDKPSTNEKNYKVASLNPNTQYVFQVRGDYGENGKSAWASVYFTTKSGLESLQDAWIQAIADVTFTGEALTPAIVVKNGETTLSPETDYTVSYSNNTNVGQATVTIAAKEGSGYTGTATATFNIVPIVVDGSGAVKILRDQDGTRAVIDGEFGDDGAVNITKENIEVSSVVYNREFMKDTYSTMVLPFSVKTDKISGLNAVLYYNGIGTDENGDDAVRMKVLWATSEWVKSNNIKDENNQYKVYGDATLSANTPYLVQTRATTLKVTGPVTIEPTAEAVKELDGWKFRGMWEFKRWDAGDRELGYAYGFAASAPKDSKIEVGDFVKIGEGTYIYPLRAYLVSSDIPESSSPVQGVRANGAYVKRPTVKQKELPELMSVIVDSDDGNNGTTVIGKFNTRTGEFKMNNAATKRTFDVKGRNVGNKANKARGAYYGKKVK